MNGRARGALVGAVLTAGLLSACTDEPAVGSRVGWTPSTTVRTTSAAMKGVPIPRSPVGTRWQGINGVVVAVPRSWATSTEPCRPAADAVWMTGDATSPVPCPLVRAQGSFLQVGGVDVAGLQHRTEVAGFELRHGGVRCRTSASGPCTLEFAVPSLDASFRILYLGPSPSEFVTRMMHSVTLLQSGLTTVPVIPYCTEVAEAMEILDDAGLTGRSPQVDFPHYVTGTRPAAGLLTGNGETVRLTIGDG